MTKKKGIDPIESQIVRASVLESHGWSSEPNCSQCKFKVQEINTFFFVTFYFSLRLNYPFFILRDNGVTLCIAKLLGSSVASAATAPWLYLRGLVPITARGRS